MAKRILPLPGVRDEFGSADKPWAKIVAVLIEDENGNKYLKEGFDASKIETGVLNPDRIGSLNQATEIEDTDPQLVLGDILTQAASGALNVIDRINAESNITKVITRDTLALQSQTINSLKSDSRLYPIVIGYASLNRKGTIQSVDYNPGVAGWFFGFISSLGVASVEVNLPTAAWRGILYGKIQIGNLRADNDGGGTNGISIADPNIADTGWHVDQNGRMWAGAGDYDSAPIQIDQYGNIYASDTPDSLSRIDPGAISSEIKLVQPSQAGGQFSGLLTLTPLTRGATVYYTTNNSDPSDPANGARIKYTVPFNVDTSGGNKTVKAVAYKLGHYGTVSTWVFTTSASAVAAPTSSPIAGYYTTPNATYPVTLGCGTIGATIIYTTDGTTPSDSNGATYAGAINLPRGATTTIKAFAKKAGLTPSAVVSFTFNIQKGSGTGGGGGGHDGGNT